MKLKLTLIAALLAVSAMAQTPACDARIDPQLSGTGPTEAINSLLNVGADVRIRIIPDLTAPTLDSWEATMRRECPSWQAEGGNRKNNLIVFAVAIKARKSGIYYGAQWAPLLDQQWPRIQSQVMNPRFRDGDWVGGLSAGMTEVWRIILRHQENAATPPSIVINQPEPSTPTDLSGLWTLLGWMAGAGLLIYLTLTWTHYLRRKRLDDEERTAAQQAALVAQQESTNLITESASWELEGDGKALLDAAIKSYADLGWGPSDPRRDDKTTTQYNFIRDAYRRVSIDIRDSKHIGKWGGPKRPASRPVVSPEQRSDPPQPILRERVIFEEHHYRDNGPVIPPIIFVGTEPETYRTSPAYEVPSHSYGSSYTPTASDPTPAGGGSTDFGSSSSGSNSTDFGSSDSGGGGSTDF